jgi:hypothetical protein
MTRAALVDEIDRYAKNYNALERSRDAWKQCAVKADALLDIAVVDVDWRVVERARDVLKGSEGEGHEEGEAR